MQDYEKMLYKNRMNKIKYYINELLDDDFSMEEIAAIVAESFYNQHRNEIEKAQERKRAKRSKKE